MRNFYLNLSLKSGMINALSILGGIFIFRSLLGGLSSEVVLSLASAWWLALYVGRIIKPTWLAIAVSIVCIGVAHVVAISADLESALGIKSSDAGEMLSLSFFNGLLYSTPLIVNLIVDKILEIVGSRLRRD